jgi:hypothetical protein
MGEELCGWLGDGKGPGKQQQRRKRRERRRLTGRRPQQQIKIVYFPSPRDWRKAHKAPMDGMGENNPEDALPPSDSLGDWMGTTGRRAGTLCGRL